MARRCAPHASGGSAKPHNQVGRLVNPQTIVVGNNTFTPGLFFPELDADGWERALALVLPHAAARAAKGEDKSYNAVRAASARRDPNFAQRHGLSAPVDVYPIYENAGRAAYGQTLTEAQAESGAIWSRFSEIAAANDGAEALAIISDLGTPTRRRPSATAR